MSSPLTTTKSRLKSRLLFTVGGMCFIGALLVMSLVKAPIHAEQENNNDDESVIYPSFQVEQIAAVPNLGVLTDQVRPLQQTTRVVTSGLHSPEFRGTKFVLEYRNRYSVQIVQIGKEEIIKNFLQQRSDRQNFIYMRLNNQNKPERYVLLYGIYDGEQEARSVLSTLNLHLPVSIQPSVEKIASYAPYVNDMGADEGAEVGKLYEVRLTNALLPRVALPVLDPVPVSQIPMNIDEAGGQKTTLLSEN